MCAVLCVRAGPVSCGSHCECVTMCVVLCVHVCVSVRVFLCVFLCVLVCALVCAYVCVCVCGCSYPSNKLSHHASPGPIGPRYPIMPVSHQPDAVLELEDVGKLLQHVHAEALVSLVPLQGVVVWPQHHVRVLLEHTSSCQVSYGGRAFDYESGGCRFKSPSVSIIVIASSLVQDAHYDRVTACGNERKRLF